MSVAKGAVGYAVSRKSQIVVSVFRFFISHVSFIKCHIGRAISEIVFVVVLEAVRSIFENGELRVGRSPATSAGRRAKSSSEIGLEFLMAMERKEEKG